MTNDLNLLEKYRITPTELFVCKTILLAVDGEDQYLVRYFNILKSCNVDFRSILVSLQDKGIILKSYKIPESGETLDVYSIPFNKMFVKTFYRSSFTMGKELFDCYPQTTVVNGCVYALRRISKKFNSLEDAFNAYGKAIKWNNKTHEKIVNLVKWGIENDYSFTTLDDFIVDNAWNSIEAIKEGNAVNINFNAITQL